MTADVDRVLAMLDRRAVQRQIAELRGQIEAITRAIEKREAVLELAERWSAAEPVQGNTANGSTNGHGRDPVRAAERRQAMLSFMAETGRPWLPRDLRDALAARGVDLDGGTPVKNMLWRLSKSGKVVRHDDGTYELPASSGNGVHAEQEGLRV